MSVNSRSVYHTKTFQAVPQGTNKKENEHENPTLTNQHTPARTYDTRPQYVATWRISFVQHWLARQRPTNHVAFAEQH